MSGQVCVFHGAAEFSRDPDLATTADPANLRNPQRARGSGPKHCFLESPHEA